MSAILSCEDSDLHPAISTESILEALCDSRDCSFNSYPRLEKQMSGEYASIETLGYVNCLFYAVP